MKVYISAPLAQSFKNENSEELIKLVNSIDLILKEFKIDTYMTYRDLLRWGKVTYNPITVHAKRNKEFQTADILLAVHPDEGIGPNITLGMAEAFKKPVIIVLNKNFDMDSLPGLIYQGFKEVTQCEIITYENIDELRKKLRKSIKTFLKK
ncbi:MAG: hypothetical protein HYW23_03430 [Candidatus Aenigmarchaeota archaeon]|nr:hypothetical protein [Candidatus Aenigmarchaeota archaeon]